MRNTIFSILSLCFMGGIALAENNTDDIQFGKYKSPSSSYFTDIEISDWAGEILIEGLARYDGYLFKFDGELVLKDDQYSGRGNLRVDYTHGLSCSYPMRFIIKMKGTELFLKVHSPTSVYTTIPATWVTCPAAPGYGVSTDKDPHTFIIDEK